MGEDGRSVKAAKKKTRTRKKVRKKAAAKTVKALKKAGAGVCRPPTEEEAASFAEEFPQFVDRRVVLAQEDDGEQLVIKSCLRCGGPVSPESCWGPSDKCSKAPVSDPAPVSGGGQPKVVGQEVTDRYAIYHGDCVDVVRSLPERSVHYSIFSPPFSSLYTYSNSSRDMGNSRGDEEFFAHMDFLIPELLRVTQPGRLCSFHCMLLPTSKVMHGYIGLRDFRGDLIRAFEAHGWIFHSEVVIWKDPVTSMQRTKALGLLHKTVRTNASMSRQGIPDYLVTMRRPGPAEERVEHDAEGYPVSLWQRVASPVWMDINPSDTLQHRSAREHDDEKHICPLQLDVIRRGVRLWTNPGDVVLSPFAGIGSEGFVALEEGRRFVGAELKESYYRQARANLERAATQKQGSLFG